MNEATRGSPRPRLRHAVGAGIAVLLLGTLVPGPVVAGPEQTKKELERARDRAAELQDELTEAREHEQAVQAELQVITARVSQATAEVEALAAAIFQTRNQIKRRDRRIDGLQSNLDARAR